MLLQFTNMVMLQSTARQSEHSHRLIDGLRRVSFIAKRTTCNDMVVTFNNDYCLQLYSSVYNTKVAYNQQTCHKHYALEQIHASYAYI